MFGFSQEDFDASIPIIFKAKETIEFGCKDVKENTDKDSITMTCKILSGEFKDRDYRITINDGNNDFARERKVQFALEFWTAEELKSNNFKLARLIGKRFSAVAGAPREYNGRTYQDVYGYKNLSGKEDAAQSEPQPEPEAPKPTDDF